MLPKWYDNKLEVDKESKEFIDLFSVARTNVALATGMFSYPMFKCNYYTCTEHLDYAASFIYGGENIVIFNRDFFISLPNDKQRAFVILHEILHIFLEHQQRCFDLGNDGYLYNVAADYNINLTCKGIYKNKSGIICFNEKYKKYIEVPDWVKYDEEFIGMSTDQIYEILKQNNQKNDMKPDMDDVSSEPIDQSKTIQNRQIMVSSMSMNHESIGENELGHKKYIQDLCKPKISWVDILTETVISSIRNKWTYSKISRRNHGDVIFPSTTGEKINILYGIDSSGSMKSSDLQKATSEIYGIVNQFDAWKIHMVTCDTKVHELGVYSSEEGDEYDDIPKEVIGGGGTTLQPMLNYIDKLEEEGEEITCCIILTDGLISNSDLNVENVSIPVVVVVTSNVELNIKNTKTIHLKQL